MIDFNQKYILLSDIADECCLSFTALKKFVEKNVGVEGIIRKVNGKSRIVFTSKDARLIIQKHEGSGAQPWAKKAWWPTKRELIPACLWLDEDSEEERTVE